jgi:hypothetical protein
MACVLSTASRTRLPAHHVVEIDGEVVVVVVVAAA